MRKQAVMIFGAPGSGKGTQANLLMWNKGFHHFDSGKYLRGVIYDPANQSDPTIARERAINESGKLNTPKWVLGLFKKETTKIAKAGMSIVYSGSPRTMFEAFGTKSVKGLIDVLIKLYGKENVRVMKLKISPEASARRNSKRRTCVICGTGVLATSSDTECPICAGELKTRVDDRPEVAATRIKEYETRTMPILAELSNRGFAVSEVDGELPPYQVYKEILRHLE